MILGVDYYPEHWPESRWPIDAQLMQEVGINVVRLAEFAWARLEPQPGEYDWAWLERAIQALSDQGLRVILGTPTAAPPAWLSHNYPETLPVDAEGRVRRFGSRRHYCPNSPVYRQFTRQIVSALAQRYGHDPRVVGWQVDNEFGDHDTARCYCPNCAAAFRCWLQNRYSNLDALNIAWGSVFWSQTYSKWEQIEPPNLTITTPNPSHQLDYYRFSSDSYLEYLQLQLETLRSTCQDSNGAAQFITHNFMGLFPDLDLHQLAASLDFAAWDSYPTGQTERWRPIVYPPGMDAQLDPSLYASDAGDPLITGMAHDLTRGLKQAPFWVMEQQCGSINWGFVNQGVLPGTTRLWTWNALAHGAAGVIFFRWRACLYAQEQYHSGLLKHDASPAVGFGDLQAMHAERQLMAQVAAEPYLSKVALLFSYEDLWALQIQPHRQDLHPWRHLFTYYQALRQLGVQLDLISYNADLGGYKLVIAPSTHLVGEVLAARLEGYIRDGGTLLLGIRSGFKTPSNLVVDEPLPGALRRLVGATVCDWHSLSAGIGYNLESSIPSFQGLASTWIEALEPWAAGDDSARTLARYTSGPFEGCSALCEHPYGKGRALYLGFYPDLAQARALAVHLLQQVEIPCWLDLPAGLVLHQRGAYTLLLNFSEQPVHYTFRGRALSIPSRDLVVFKED